MRIPGWCNFDPDTTVHAHIRRGGVAGMGQKPVDTCGVWACSGCHDAMDNRAKTEYSRLEMDSMILEALCRTLTMMDRLLKD